MASFPEFFLSESDKKADDYKWAKNWIDAIVEYDNSIEMVTRRRSIQKNFDTFNGIHESRGKKFITQAYGNALSTDYVPFHMARTKERLLFGEFLDIGLKSTVESINPDSIAENLKQRNFISELMEAKPYIDAVRKTTGLNVLNGMQIPEQGSPEAEIALKPKRRNEIIMQRIIDKKIEEDQLRMKLYQDFQNLVITSECHGTVETDSNGVDTYYTENPKFMIFQESPGDPFIQRTPFDGKKRLLFKHEIFTMFPNLGEKDREKIKNMGSSEGGPQDNQYYEKIDGQTAIWCYYCQWKSNRPVYVKEKQTKKYSTPSYYNIEPEVYEKYQNGFDKRVAAGEFKMNVYYKEDVWEGWRIGNNVYYGIQRQEKQIQKVVNGKARAFTSFVHCTYGTIDGKRISLEELIYELGEVHDLIMHIIKREIKKVKGKTYTYDERFLPPGSSFLSVVYDSVEHGVIRFNSAIDGIPEDKVIQVANFIQSVDLGLPQSFGVMLELKREIEQTIDKITGINEEREGYSKASATATGARQNIDASRSITKDLFFMHQIYGSLVITKLVDRVKLNRKYLESKKGIFLDDDDVSFLRTIEDLSMDDFAAYLTDGRSYQEIKDFAMQLFPQEINAQQLRTKDVIRFRASQSLAEGLEVLDKAWGELDKIRQDALQQKSDSEAQDRKLKYQVAKEDREDWQAHEKEIAGFKEKAKAGQQLIKVGAEGMANPPQSDEQYNPQYEQPVGMESQSPQMTEMPEVPAQQ